jgi:hypothetical protein
MPLMCDTLTQCSVQEYITSILIKGGYKDVPGVMEHTCNPSTQKVEVEGLRVPGQPGLHSETLSQKQNKTPKIMQSGLGM